MACIMSVQHNFIQRTFLLANNGKAFFSNHVGIPYFFVTSNSARYLVCVQYTFVERHMLSNLLEEIHT